MTSAVIQSEGLGKSYQRGALRQTTLLRDHLARFLKSPGSAFRRPKDETFWALKDVSLDVREGEVLGLIGRNGAGKTTLLKILSRITRPTAGWAEIHGRVGSLLEVGTGFHPELTGRENVFMSGAILGMRSARNRRGIRRNRGLLGSRTILDTSVKHYQQRYAGSSGFRRGRAISSRRFCLSTKSSPSATSISRKNVSAKWATSPAPVAPSSSSAISSIRFAASAIASSGSMMARSVKDGNTHEVVSAYESAMARGDLNGHPPAHAANTKGGFLRWEIIDPQSNEPHFLNSLGPVTLKFIGEVTDPSKRPPWHCAFQRRAPVDLGLGRREPAVGNRQASFVTLFLCFRFPGPYFWHVSLYDEGQEVDVWECLPEMVVATETHQHQYDHWNGILNIPSRFEIMAEDKIGKDMAL